jgi:hypothetical protein
MERAEGYIESGPHDISGEPHWMFWFASKGDKDVWLTAISQAALAEIGVDCSEIRDEG